MATRTVHCDPAQNPRDNSPERYDLVCAYLRLDEASVHGPMDHGVWDQDNHMRWWGPDPKWPSPNRAYGRPQFRSQIRVYQNRHGRQWMGGGGPSEFGADSLVFSSSNPVRCPVCRGEIKKGNSESTMGQISYSEEWCDCGMYAARFQSGVHEERIGFVWKMWGDAESKKDLGGEYDWRRDRYQLIAEATRFLNDRDAVEWYARWNHVGKAGPGFDRDDWLVFADWCDDHDAPVTARRVRERIYRNEGDDT